MLIAYITLFRIALISRGFGTKLLLEKLCDLFLNMRVLLASNGKILCDFIRVCSDDSHKLHELDILSMNEFHDLWCVDMPSLSTILCKKNSQSFVYLQKHVKNSAFYYVHT